MAKAKKSHSTCTVMRRKYVQTGTLSMATGDAAMTGGEWVTEPCGTPLFRDDHKQSGICPGCASGWTHPHNYPVAGEGARS